MNKKEFFSNIKVKNTNIESIFSKTLWNRGVRFRKNSKDIFGKPDVYIKKYRIAIFIDGDFWHGKDWHIRKFDHKSNKDFWLSKIERNIARDDEVNRKLKKDGWKVFRFWGSEILKNPDKCAKKVENCIKKLKTN